MQYLPIFNIIIQHIINIKLQWIVIHFVVIWAFFLKQDKHIHTFLHLKSSLVVKQVSFLMVCSTINRTDLFTCISHNYFYDTNNDVSNCYHYWNESVTLTVRPTACRWWWNHAPWQLNGSVVFCHKYKYRLYSVGYKGYIDF